MTKKNYLFTQAEAYQSQYVHLLTGVVRSVYKRVLNALCTSLEIVIDSREVVKYITVKI